MLSYNSCPSSCDSLRLEYRRHVFGAGLSHSRLSSGRVGRNRCCCNRQSFVVIGCYAVTVLLIQNTLIAYHAATRGSTSPATTSDATQTPTENSTVQLGSVVASSSSQSVVVAAMRPAPQPGRLLTENEYYSRRPHKVNEYRHKALLMPRVLCWQDTLMVILVHSSPTNLDRREAIRVTWGDAVRHGQWPNDRQSESTLGRLDVAFVIGLHNNEAVNRAVRQEYARHHDIILGDFIDHYQNMTLKSLLDLKVVDERCPGVRYLLKTDDDMIINLPYLLDILGRTSTTRSFMGPYNPRSNVYRQGVWKLTRAEFPFNFFPPYESGSAYVITGDLIHELFVTAEYVPHIFIDDVYVTGILGRVLGVRHIRQSGFAYWGTKTPTACDLVRRKIITGTKMHPQRLCALWNDLQLNPKC